MTSSPGDPNDTQPEPKDKPTGFSRRAFITTGVTATGVLLLGGIGYRVSALPDGAPAIAGGVLTRQELAIIDALSLAHFPPGNPFGVDGKQADISGYTDRYLTQLTPVDQKIIRSLFWLYDQATFLGGHVRSVRHLDPQAARKYVMAWETSSLGWRRDLGMSLRQVLGTAYFAHPDVRKVIGYDEPCGQTGPTLVRIESRV